MQLKILNPYKNHPHQGREYDTAHYDTFQRNEILFNYVLNKLYKLKDSQDEKGFPLITEIHSRSGIQESELYQRGMNNLLHMKKVWGLSDRQSSVVRSIWEQVCRCESDGKWTVPYIKKVGKHKHLKKILTKNHD